jgi:hypothetical protein
VTTAASCTVRQSRRRDLEVVTVENGELRLAILPQVGGRLISIEVSGDELLWRNPAYLDRDLHPVTPLGSWPRPDGTMRSWANIGGSKTWPAPQGWSRPDEWPGPPDPVLDAGAYGCTAHVDESGAARVSLTSAVDERTGLRITREFHIPPTGRSFVLTPSIQNCSDKPVRWAAWEVTQIDTSHPTGATATGEVLVSVAGDAEPIEMLSLRGDLSYSASAGRVRVPVQNTIGKLGFPGSTGRLEWHRPDGAGLVQEARVEPGATYPDGGCPAELWLQYPTDEPLMALGGLRPDAHLIEMELLSPLTTLTPGHGRRLEITWHCRGKRS